MHAIFRSPKYYPSSAIRAGLRAQLTAGKHPCRSFGNPTFNGCDDGQVSRELKMGSLATLIGGQPPCG